ncbi:MAG TPA: uroporphyrinogen-III synthase [Terriglobales bacterium]|nr:uroporphyrinogen-III synthase [Terriglobales bacterium]
MANPGFAGLKVLTLESRRAQEMARLIANSGGEPVVAPSMREVPLESNKQALEFADALVKERLDVVIFLTGVGTRALFRVVESVHPREKFIAALSSVAVVARGPKPVAALREMGVPITLTIPEPNTWREILHELDQSKLLETRGRRVAVQEYGVANPELLAGLAERGAQVTSVPVYEWMLPEDTAPLRAAIGALTRGEINVALFTSSAQLRHLLQIADEMKAKDAVLQALSKTLVVSIGPITSEELQKSGIAVDLEPSHPKMGFLVKEASEQSATLLQKKRSKKD